MFKNNVSQKLLNKPIYWQRSCKEANKVLNNRNTMKNKSNAKDILKCFLSSSIHK